MTEEQRLESIRRGFIAERRNLLLTSVVLLLVEYSELRFGQINVLGNVAELRDPNVVGFLLWIFWFYFGWRYYQHYGELTDTSIKGIYRNRLYQLLLPIAHERYAQLFGSSPTNYDKLDRTFRFETPSRHVHSPAHVTVNLEATANYRLPNGAWAQDAKRSHNIELYWKDLLRPNLKTAYYLLKNTWQITEYHLPFVVASIPLVYVLFKTSRTAWKWLAN
jgi:hypothetical protein